MDKLIQIILTGIIAVLTFFLGKKTESEQQAKEDLSKQTQVLQTAQKAKEKAKKEGLQAEVLNKDKHNRDSK